MEVKKSLLSKNILESTTVNKKLKDEYVSMINRLEYNKTIMEQLYRNMNYQLLYNQLYDNIIYLLKQKKYFERILKDELLNEMNILIDSHVKTYSYYMNKLN